MNPIAIIAYVLLALLPGYIAKNRGRSFLKYFLLSFLVSPIIMTIIALTQPKASDNEETKPDKNWICPKCGIENDAIFYVCRKCGIARPAEPKKAPEIRDNNTNNASTYYDNLKTNKDWACQKCGTMNDAMFLMCRKCGATRPTPMQPTDHLMLSQFVAYYVYQNSEPHKDQYIATLIQLGFSKEEAKKLFDFESDILKKYNKQYLLDPKFTNMWLFELTQPFFKQFPKEKGDILNESFLTLSELCKIIDEAEWHYWNSHEKALSDEVWEEIYEWHRKGKGGDFGIEYFEMISSKTKIDVEKLFSYSTNEGQHLSIYKWRGFE